MAKYINSTDIEVFPIAKRRVETAPGTRIFTEKNISNLTRQLLSTTVSGYIISCTSSATDNSKFDVSFNLYGYYFNITNLDTSGFSGDSQYAVIILENDELVGQDEGGSYKGLTLTDKVDSVSVAGNQKKYFLKLFEKSASASWQCSSQNFGLMSCLSVGGIDGKPRQ